MRTPFSLAAFVLGLTGSLPGQCFAIEAVDRAVAAVGGGEALRGIKTNTVVGAGVRFEPGQGRTLDAPPSQYPYTYVARQDVAHDRLNIWVSHDTEYMTTIAFTQVIDRDVGYFDGKDGMHSPVDQAPMLSSRVAAVQKHQRLFHPELLLRSALEAPAMATLSGETTLHGEAHQIVSLKDKFQPIRLYISKTSGLVSKLATTEDDPILGDAEIEVEFRDWRMVSGVRMPFSLTLSEGGIPLQTETRSSVVVNAELDDRLFLIPDQVRSTPNRDDARRGEAASEELHRYAALGTNHDFNSAVTVKSALVARGVHHLTGGIAFSLAIEMRDGIVVVEAPIDADRSEDVIGKIKELIPGKPITHVINTHRHDDHAGGLRAYVAEGATVVTAKSNEDYFNKIFSAPHTVRPDQLQLRPVAPKIEAVASAGLVISDGERRVRVVPISSTHSDDMLLVYVEDAKLAFVADIYSPGWPRKIIPYEYLAAQAKELHHDIVKDLDLDIQTIVGGHGAGVSDLETLRPTFPK